MSTSAESTTPATDTRPGEVRTYRGRTVEELIPRIRAELGPGAIILRERQGLTGGVGGFFAKRCVEIDAQAAPRLSVYADDELDEGDEGPATAATPAPAPAATPAPAPAATAAPDPAAAASAPLPHTGTANGGSHPDPLPGSRLTPDPFAGLLARWEQVATNVAFTPASTPDPFRAANPLIPPATNHAMETAERSAAPVEEATPEREPADLQATTEFQSVDLPEATREFGSLVDIQPVLEPAAAEPAPAPAEPAPTMDEPSPTPAAQPSPELSFIAFDELGAEPELPASLNHTPEVTAPEPAPEAGADPAVAPEPEPIARELPIPVDVAPPVAAASSVFRPRPLKEARAGEPAAGAAAIARETTSDAAPDATDAAALGDEQRPATEISGQSRLRDRLISHGLSAPLAQRVASEAAEAAGSQAEPMLAANARAALAGMLPAPEGLPVNGGVVAIVGPSGSGKTRVVAALAAAHARQGHGVTVAQIGAAQDDALSELLDGEEVDLIPALTIRATVREVESARDEDLVILDTPSTTPGDSWGLESLRETLGRFLPDAVLLCAPATYTERALSNLVEHHDDLHIDELVATHGDQAGMLGTVAELAIETRIPLGHVHSGLDVATAISSIDPHSLAGDLVR
ncbi:MAG TPA: hypothetical protein VFN65_07510 [Solirubrobacteraceae bacterium]|nr:hypothetical protein [Solirubrobacteraceae bacterium]